MKILPQRTARPHTRSLGSFGRPGLRHVTSAVAALEFGIIAPVMAVLVLAVFDISKAAILWEQVWRASRTIAESATTLAIQPDGSSSLTGEQADQALSAVLVEIPWLRLGIATSLPANGAPVASAVLTSVNYVPQPNCTSGCKYVANVEWSKAYAYPHFGVGSAVLRPCSVTTIVNGKTETTNNLVQRAPGLPFSLNAISTADVASLPSDNINGITISVPDSFLMADVHLTFTPYYFAFITGPVTFTATSYLPVRSNVAGALANTIGTSLTADPFSADPYDSKASVCT